MARSKREPALMDRGLSDTDLLRLAVSFCNQARNTSFGGTLSDGSYVDTDSYALAAAIDTRLAQLKAAA